MNFGDPEAMEGYANAALIVRAVNAHDELVEALEVVNRYLRQWAGSHYETLHEAQIVRAALAKAKGETP